MGCRHLSQIQHVHPETQGCAECLRSGGKWVELRLCLSCGHVGCCDGSPGRHARAHAAQAGHPILRSFLQRDDWIWCALDDEYLDPVQIDQALEAAYRHACRTNAERAAGGYPVPIRGPLLY